MMTASAASAVTSLFWPKATPMVACPPLDVLCIPGGGGVNPLLEDEAVLAFVRKRAVEARYVTSVCSGALVLGAAGLFRASAHHPLERTRLPRRLRRHSVEGRIVEDGKLITAGGVTAGIDFGLALVARLAGQVEAETVQLSLEYAPAPPFQVRHAMFWFSSCAPTGHRIGSSLEHPQSGPAFVRARSPVRPPRKATRPASVIGCGL